MSRKLDLTGEQFGRWLVLSEAERNERRVSQWLCRCACGTEKIVRGDTLQDGKSKSCGCLQREEMSKKMKGKKIGLTHGFSYTTLYTVWHGMKRRCYGVNHDHYHRYGGRGITVCDEWKDDAEAFCLWCLSNGYKEGFTIDRRDNNKGYSPDNCRFSTRKEQADNRENTQHLTYNGMTKTLVEWAKETGMKRYTIYNRLRMGWSVDRIFAESIGEYFHNTVFVGAP